MLREILIEIQTATHSGGNPMKTLYFVLLTLPAVALATSPALADDDPDTERYSTSNLQISFANNAKNDYITGYGADDGDRIQVRFEHQSDYRFGENYFFVDWVNFDNPAGAAFGEGDTGTEEIYGLWNGNIQLSKLTKKDVSVGIFKDFSAEVRLQAGSFFTYRASSFGLGTYFDMPGFRGPNDKFQFNWWRRSNCDEFVTGPFGSIDGSCYDNHNLWGITTRKYWEAIGTNWNHQMILRYQQSTTSDKNDPDAAARHDRIFLELEIFAQVYENFQLGFRYEYFWDEGGIDYDRVTFAPDARDSNSIPMIVFKYEFH